MQAQEQRLLMLADRLLHLRATAASPGQREGLIVQTMSAINEIRGTTPHISKKVWISEWLWVQPLLGAVPEPGLKYGICFDMQLICSCAEAQHE